MKRMDYSTNTYCKICKSTCHIAFELSPTPLEDQYLKEKIEQAIYPLRIALCPDCSFLFLPEEIHPEISYKNYLYNSSVTVGLNQHFIDYAEILKDQFTLGNNALAVDLGSNDGSMIHAWQQTGLRGVGIEPATAVARAANKCGRETVEGYFDEATAHQLIKNYGYAKIVTANYMFANVSDIISFTNLVYKILEDDGLFVIQTGYHPKQFQILMFDYIYHEHFSYFTLQSLEKLSEQCHFRIVDAHLTKPKGGSLRVVMQKKHSVLNHSRAFENLLIFEKKGKWNQYKTYQILFEQLNVQKKFLIEQLNKWAKDGKTIIGLGASHSTTTLVYHFEIAKFIKYIVDDNKIKQNTYSPGHHIPVYSTSRMYEEKPAIVLLLAWQHQKAIIEKHKKYLRGDSSFIIPLPSFRIISTA